MNLVFMFGLLGASVPTARAATPWEAGQKQIEAELAAGLQAYRGGDRAGADRHFADAYFVAYEGAGLEIAVRQFISAKRNYRLEKMFSNLRLLVRDGEEPAALESAVEQLRSALQEDVVALRGRGQEEAFGAEAAAGTRGRRSAFVQSLLVILREGFEAILLIGALVAYLQREGKRREIRVVYRAALLAVGASLLTAYLFQKVLAVSPARQEVVEGLTMLLASIVLFYVSYWLISKTQSRRWQGYVQDKVKDALGSGRMAALGSVAFLAVYREGAETVLFYQALFAGAEGASRDIWGGFAAGSLLLALIFVAFRGVVRRLPMGPFFAVTGGFLYYLAFVFAGKGIHELQEEGWVGDTPLSFVPHVELLGIFPSLQGVLVQSLFVLGLALVAARWLWTTRADGWRARVLDNPVQ